MSKLILLYSEEDIYFCDLQRIISSIQMRDLKKKIEDIENLFIIISIHLHQLFFLLSCFQEPNALAFQL